MPERDHGNGNGSVQRRKFLKGVGAAGVAAGLAGCGGQSSTGGDGGDGGGGDTTTTRTEAQATTQAESKTVEQQGEPLDSALTVAQWAVPSDSQFNPYNGTNYSEMKRNLFDRFMGYNIANAEFYGQAVGDWSFDGNSVTLTPREGLTWHNGDAAVPMDYVTQLRLDMYTGGALTGFVAPDADGPLDEIATIKQNVQANGDGTVTINFNRDINKKIILSYLQPKRLVAKDSVYGKWRKAIENASSEEELSSAKGTLSKKRISDPIGSGPFELDSTGTSQGLLTKFEDHPDADNINFPEMEYLYLDSNNKRWSALINNKTDGSATLFMPNNKLKQLPDSIRVALIARHWGMGMWFDHTDEDFGKRKVRQAIAHVLNRETIAKNSSAGTNSKVAVTTPSGLTGNFTNKPEEKWLSGVTDQFETYGPASTNTEKATQLLNEAGYVNEDGTWKREDGSTLKLPVKVTSAFSDWAAGARTIVAQLKSFGFDAELLAKGGSTYWSEFGKGDFKIAFNGWASYNYTYPYFHYDSIFNGWSAGKANVPETFENVETLGGGTETVEPVPMVRDLSTMSGDDAQNRIQEMAYMVNQTLPVLPIQEKLAQSFLSDDDWNVPPADSPKLQQYWPTEWGPRRGWWTAKRE